MMPTDPLTAGKVIPRPTVGNYEIVRKLATGGMGEVFLAKQKGPVDFSRHVVLKKLHPRLTADPHFITMFLNEARIAASLTHPNIVHIYELFQDGDGYVIVMEYVRGGTVLALLRERQRKGTKGIPFGPMIRIATSVCEALHYAYNEPGEDGEPRHVIHRDVSPSNVLVGYDGHVKLVDFGIAKALEAEAITKAATIKGKYGYMSPEQIKCQALDQRSDIFSLGTMLWEMAVGSRLFKRDNDLQMLYSILEERIPPPSERVPNLPAGLESIVMKALARSREDRYPDAAALAQDLRAIARDNEWDSEASTMSRLVKDVLPDDQNVSRPGPGSDSRPRAESIADASPASAVTRQGVGALTSSWGEPEPTDDDDELAPRIVIEEAPAHVPGATQQMWGGAAPLQPEAAPVHFLPDAEPAPAEGGITAGTWVALLVLLVASAAFWILIAPSI